MLHGSEINNLVCLACALHLLTRRTKVLDAVRVMRTL
jgi:hypothetical protein